MPSRVSLAVICHQRQAELGELLASIHDAGFDEVVVADMASTPPLDPVEGARLVRSDVNLGVAGGRNLLMRETTGDVVVFIDDDAVAQSPVGDQVRAAFDGDEGLSLLAFQVTRPDGRRRWEQPFRWGRSVPGTAVECAYFVGCGHAIRRTDFVASGGYDERLFYATQELDLSFKLVRNGGRLGFDPAIVVEHRPSAKGRAPQPNVPGMLLHDRLLVVRSHLPSWAAIPHAAAWALITWRQARAVDGLGHWRAGFGTGLRSTVQRRPLPRTALQRMHRLGGRVLY